MKFLSGLKGIVNGISLNSNLYSEEIKKNDGNASSPFKRDSSEEEVVPPLNYEVEHKSAADCFIPVAAAAAAAAVAAEAAKESE